MRDRVLVGAAAGLFLGIVAALAEWLHVGVSVRGAGFQPLILLYAELVDGGIGVVLGIAAALIWSAVLWLRARPTRNSPGSVVNAMWDGPYPVTVIRRRTILGPAAQPAPAGAAISRRAALRLGAAAVSAGALSLGALALITRQREGGSTAYAYAPANAVPRSPDLLEGASASASPAASAAAANTPTAAAPARTNLILVTMDTIRADQLGVYGHPTVRTPALDKLASQSARFNLHLIQEPATNPSHAAMFTGMYPPSNGVRVHMVDKLPASVATLAGTLAEAGYYTAGLYSWMSLDDQYCGFQRGFQTYENVSGSMPSAFNNPVLRNIAAQYRVAEQYLALPKGISAASGVQAEMEWKNKGRADLTTDSAIAELSMLGKQPFFLWVHYFDAHYPYLPPAPFDNEYDPSYAGKLTFSIDTIQSIEQGKIQPSPDDVKKLQSLYQGEISFLDTNIQRLFDAIDQQGLTNDTALVVTADHGESFGEHSTLKEDTDYFHPHDLYNAEQRVPLMIRYPGRIKAGTVIQAPTEAIDLFPTFLELADVKVPDQNQGKSLLRLLDGTDDGSRRVSYSMMPDYVFTSITVPGWKLILNTASGTRELYNLGNDLEETHDLSDSQPVLVKSLSDKLQTWMKAEKIQ